MIIKFFRMLMQSLVHRLIEYFSLTGCRAAWLQKGNKHYIAGNYERALKYYGKILKHNPCHLAALCNHTGACLFLKKYDEAAAGAETLVKNFPEQACGWSLRGRIWLEKENYAAAVADLRHASELDSADYWNYNYLSQALQKNSFRKEAAAAALRAVELSGGEDSQHLNLAYTLYENSLEDGAASVHGILKKWYKKYPHNPIVKQSYNSFFPDEKYAKSDTGYVEKVFDNFAASFDEILHDLEYDSPRQIAEIISRNVRPDTKACWRILDLGCGTGLCGKALDSQFKKRFLCGVDLSAPMLEEARAKGIYNHLEKAEIEQYLGHCSERYNLVVSADVLTYFGVLENVFSGVCSVLEKGGYFAFSSTQNNLNKKDYFLHVSGRFIHSPKYLENVLQKNGFRIVEMVDSVLRREGEKEVLGWIVLARKNM